MIIRLLLLTTFLFNITLDSKKNLADDALQKVLELDEVESFFSKAPRFSSSSDRQVLLLKSKEIELAKEHKINQIPLLIANEDAKTDKALTVFLHLTEFNLTEKEAFLELKIQNAALLYEEKKNVRLEAQLERNGNKWEVKTYKLDKVNISY
ncbi:hypothetical protein GCM10027429_18590 [Marivirga atlantica]|jgi:hypothetical protein|uniref:Uncharacterized protein n=1 Tax=Marivirga atlantica TaxID=1548457 RepID=A0A937AAT4_9BACT|nr:hypothetical protein [Marivirga atlantica]MBL0765476.1 hypothetical protein [Marivirga atlantica]